MIGKKDNHDIFNQYKQVLLEQAENNEFLSLINKIKTSSLDQASKDKVIEMVKAQMEHGMGDADAAGYASYPEAVPAMDQDDTEAVNEQDPEFAKELARERKRQQEEYPEKEESEEGGYADPASFFGGPTTPISQMEPMKFPAPQPPKQKTLAETDPEGWAKYQKDKADALQRQKQEAIEKAHAGRGKASNYDPNIKIGADPSDPVYAAKKAKWLAAFAAGAGRQ